MPPERSQRGARIAVRPVHAPPAAPDPGLPHAIRGLRGLERPTPNPRGDMAAKDENTRAHREIHHRLDEFLDCIARLLARRWVRDQRLDQGHGKKQMPDDNCVIVANGQIARLQSLPIIDADPTDTDSQSDRDTQSASS